MILVEVGQEVERALRFLLPKQSTETVRYSASRRSKELTVPADAHWLATQLGMEAQASADCANTSGDLPKDCLNMKEKC